MAAVHILIFGEIAGFKIVPYIATHVKKAVFLRVLTDDKYSAIPRRPLSLSFKNTVGKRESVGILSLSSDSDNILLTIKVIRPPLNHFL